MSRAKYIPSKWAVHPGRFGKSATIAWKRVEDVSENELVQYEAARLQHAYAVAIREAVYDQGLDLSQFARRSKQDYQRFTSVLRGAVVMRLEDVARCQLTLERLAGLDAEHDLPAVDVRGRAYEVMSLQEKA